MFQWEAEHNMLDLMVKRDCKFVKLNFKRSKIPHINGGPNRPWVPNLETHPLRGRIRTRIKLSKSEGIIYSPFFNVYLLYTGPYARVFASC